MQGGGSLYKSASMSPTTTATTSAARTGQSRFAATMAGSGSLLWTFAAIVGLYLVWVIVHQHEKVKEGIQPKNIAMNLHNMAAIVVTVLVSFGLLKIALAKAVSAKLPGANTVSQIVEAAV